MGTADEIVVGRNTDTQEVFIAVPPDRHEVIRSAIQGVEKHSLRFTVDDVEWLIWALQKETGDRCEVCGELVEDKAGLCDGCDCTGWPKQGKRKVEGDG